MDAMQLMQMLGAPVPAAPMLQPKVPAVPPGIGPGGTSPPVVTPGFLPGNLSNLMTLGQRPVPQGPTPIAAPRQLDIAGLMAKFAPGFEVPKIAEMQMAPATQRAAPTFADPTKMLETMGAARPTNNMVDDETFGQERFADAMSAAALAAAGAGDLGSLLAGAGGAFGATAGAATKDRRAEELLFAERNREFDVQMAGMQWEVDQAKAEQANAVSDVDFQNAQAREAQANNQLQLTLQQKEAERGAFLQKAGMELDLLQSNQQTAMQAAQIETQNQDRQRAHQAKYEPQWSISDDGSTLTQSYLDPATNKMVVLQEPIGIQGQMAQIAKQAAMLGEGGPEYEMQNFYANMARISPERLKRQVIIDALKTGGDKIFEPEDAGTEFGGGLLGTPSAGKAKNAADFFNVGKTLTDQFTTSDFEQIRNEVKMHIEDRVEKGLLDPTQSVTAYTNMLAARLEPMFDKEAIKRARSLNDPALNYGLDLLK